MEIVGEAQVRVAIVVEILTHIGLVKLSQTLQISRIPGTFISLLLFLLENWALSGDVAVCQRTAQLPKTDLSVVRLNMYEFILILSYGAILLTAIIKLSSRLPCATH